MYTSHKIKRLLVLFLLLFTAVIFSNHCLANAYTIHNMHATLHGDTLVLELQGDSIPAYTQYELFSPTRLVIDIADGTLSPGITVPEVLPENSFATLAATILRDKSPQIMRFEIGIADSHTYKVEKQDNNLIVRLEPKGEKNNAISADDSAQNTLNDIIVKKNTTQTEILLQADRKIEKYRNDSVTGQDNLHDSMYIDINDIDGSKLVRETIVGTSVDKIRVATRGSGVRVIFVSSAKDLFSYHVQPDDKGLLITVDNEKSIATPNENDKALTKSQAAENAPLVSDPTLDALIGSSEEAINERSSIPEAKTAAEELEDSFGFAGYKTKRISVDFYKIDLHNVFRLFRQISDVNLIVDDEVNGSLTLALNDVPWDFALDIILNLSNLKKEERHNTIVIYPAKKEFVWPNRAADNLTFEADVEVIEQDALLIQSVASQPAEIMKAKEILRRATIEEKNNDIEDAAAMYEEAFALWSTNDKISNKLAALYLVSLGNNAKAVHFAKETLSLNKNDSHAALYAAIASANMDKDSDAMDFFAQSIGGEPPLKEALISYAAFSEKKNQPEAALKLLNRYAETYSDTVDTLISKARIYDSMGKTAMATEQYKTLLYSGYQLDPGVKKYIRGRLTMATDQLTN